MAYRLNADDLERIRDRLVAARAYTSVVVAPVTQQRRWMVDYSRDVRQLRAAYSRERRIRVELEEHILHLIALAEFERDETPEERLARIGRGARQLVGLQPGSVLRLAPRTVRP